MTLDPSITLPNASGVSSFENLLKNSLKRKYPPTIFSKLYKDFKNIYQQQFNDKLNSLILFSNLDKSYLQREYVYEILVRADLSNTCEEFINYFIVISPQLSINDQKLVLLLINQLSDKFPWKVYAGNNAVLDALSNYSNQIRSKADDFSTDLISTISSFVKLLSNLFSNSKSIKLDNEFIIKITDFSEWLSINNFSELYISLQAHLSDYNIASIKLGFNKTDSFSSISKINYQSSTNLKNIYVKKEKENSRVLKLKKSIWLSQKFTVEFIDLDDDFIMSFKELINLSNVSVLNCMVNIATELLVGVFESYQSADNKTRIVWSNYITYKIPLFFKNVLKINKQKLEKILLSLLNDELSHFKKYSQLLATFEKHLIELDLISSGVLNINPITNTSNILTVEELKHNFTVKILDCNPEFTSIEEIGMIEFLNDINKSIILKQKFSELVLETINSFFLIGETLKLRRLLITCTINFDLLDIVILFESPYKILTLLLKYLENQVSQTPDSTNTNQSNQPDLMMDLDVSSDDSSNTQEILSDLTTFLVFSQFIISRYNLLLQSKDEYHPYENTIALLNNVKTIIDKEQVDKNNENLTHINPATETKIVHETVNRWIMSLFDTSNVDGISDDLIKLSTPIEYSKIIPMIVYEAITCNFIGWLDDNALVCGLEYLHEKFLVGWIYYVVDALCQIKWMNKGEKMDMILNNVLTQLLTVKSTESMDIQIVIKMIKEATCEKVIKFFPDFYKNENIEDTNTKLNESTTVLVKDLPLKIMVNNLIGFISSNDKSHDEEYGFSLPKLWSYMLSDKLAIDTVLHELRVLLTETNLNEELCYEAVSMMLVTYTKWIVGDSIQSVWPNALSYINNSNSLYQLSKNNLILNKKPSKVTVQNYSIFDQNTDMKDNKPADENVDKGEASFFGFIQESKFESSEMDVDSTEAEKSQNGVVKVEKEESVVNSNQTDLDIYGDNLIVIAYENRGDLVTEKFIRKILDHL